MRNGKMTSSGLTLLFLCAFLSSVQAVAVTAHAPIKVGILFDKGGKDDQSFNNAAFRGLQRAEANLKVTSKTVEAKDDHSFEHLLRSFASKDFDLIIAIGIAQKEAMSKLAPLFPQKQFAIVDAEVSAPNVRSLLFEEHEGAYLMGALAALRSTTGKIGFIGGMDIPLIRRFQVGYEAGAKQVKPSILVRSGYVGVTGDAWNNPPRMKELALAQYDQGVDVIFGAAGASGMGLFDAAQDRKAFAIGVDSNQNGIKPGRVLTSMLKRVDEAVYATIELASKGEFKPGVARFGLKNGGIDYAMDEHNKGLISPEVLKKIELLKKEILAGKIKVPDYYRQHP